MKNALSDHRKLIASRCVEQGIRATAKLAGVNPMRVSRFVNGTGGDDARIHYLLANAVGLELIIRRRV